MVFYARHWELTEWLRENWDKEIKAEAERAGFPQPTIDRLSSLLDDTNRRRLDQVFVGGDDQALEVATRAMEAMSEILQENAKCQCDAPKRKRPGSNYWERERAIRPKGCRNKDDKALWIGATIDSAPDSKGKASVFLTSWIWLKSEPRLRQAREDSVLKQVVQQSCLFGELSETSWQRKKVLAVGASNVLSHADDDFRLNVKLLVDECVAPFLKFRQEHIKRLYELAR